MHLRIARVREVASSKFTPKFMVSSSLLLNPKCTEDAISHVWPSRRRGRMCRPPLNSELVRRLRHSCLCPCLMCRLGGKVVEICGIFGELSLVITRPGPKQLPCVNLNARREPTKESTIEAKLRIHNPATFHQAYDT